MRDFDSTHVKQQRAVDGAVDAFAIQPVSSNLRFEISNFKSQISASSRLKAEVKSQAARRVDSVVVSGAEPAASIDKV